MRRWIPALAFTLLLGACTGGEAGTDATSAPDGAFVEPEYAVADIGGEGQPASFATPENRKVIHRASIEIEAEDTETVHRAIRDLVAEVDGFVQSAQVATPKSGEDQPRIELVLRVPADGLDAALDRIGALGTRVVSLTQSGDDVTEEYVDLEARISNLSLLEAELRALLADVRQNPEADPQKLLQVFNEISRVRGEIEQLEGRRQVLTDLTDLATVEVQVVPAPAVSPVVADAWAPLTVARQSLQDLVGALQVIADGAIRFGVFVVPLLLLAAVPAYFIWRFRNRFSRDIPSA